MVQVHSSTPICNIHFWSSQGMNRIMLLTESLLMGIGITVGTSDSDSDELGSTPRSPTNIIDRRHNYEQHKRICRSSSTNEQAKKIAKGFADHYRRMVMLIVMRPFNPEEISTDNEQDKVFSSEVARLNSLFDPNFKV